MKDPFTKTINIYLKVDRESVNEYFNENDPAPLYKRQLSYKLDQYLSMAAASIKRYSVVFYKFKCISEIDKQYAEPLIYALRGHYSTKLAIREREFERFKKRTWILLAVSLAIVILCQGFVMVLFNENHNLQAGLSNIIDVFSWVVLWQPFDQLLFHWNPHLKEISALKKLAEAQLIIIGNDTK